MFNVIRQIKNQANESLIASQRAIHALNADAEEFTDEQQLAIRKAFMGLKKSRDDMTVYGSNLLKRIIRWIFCGKIVNQVNTAIAEILPYRQSSRIFKQVKVLLDNEFQKMKLAYQGDQRFEFVKALDAVKEETMKSMEKIIFTRDDLEDLKAINKLTEEEGEKQDEKLRDEFDHLVDEVTDKLKKISKDFNQKEINFPKL